MKLSFRPFGLLFSVATGMLCFCPVVSSGPALALGGSAVSISNWGLSAHTVMVLGTRGSVCTGTLIRQRIVITAAHCLAGSKQIAVAYFEDGRPILQIATRTATNTGFSKNARVSIDLALLQLEEPLPSRLSPVAYDSSSSPALEIGDSLTIAGFGLSTDKDLKSAGTLRSAEVQLLPRIYPRFLRIGIDATLERLAICKGDSGGPIFANESGSRVLVGVLYAAEKTGKATTCGATGQAVRLAPQKAWIDSVIARWER